MKTPTAAVLWPLTARSLVAQVVLIVEDQNVRGLLADQFRRAGAEVVEAGDGVGGLRVALRRLPDVVVTDVSLPGLNGLDLARRLRANPRTGDVPIIVFSREAPEAVIAESTWEAGCPTKVPEEICAMDRVLSVARAAVAARRLALACAKVDWPSARSGFDR